MHSRYKRSILALAIAASAAPFALAQDHEHMHMHDAPATVAAPHAAGADGRVPVKFPAMLKEHTLANMRDHLLTLSQIQGYLAARDFDRAADLAEKRLGMSSLSLHGAHDVAPYMPKGMQDAGTAMHHAASRFAVATQEAAIDHDVPRALGALNKVTQACVACHAGYRLE
jgi:hypothetical protein